MEFTFRLHNDEGPVLAVGELADLRRSAEDGDGQSLVGILYWLGL